MTKQTFLMHPHTAEVQTKAEWLEEMPTWDHDESNTQQQQFDTLIEVEQDESGEWVAV